MRSMDTCQESHADQLRRWMLSQQGSLCSEEGLLHNSNCPLCKTAVKFFSELELQHAQTKNNFELALPEQQQLVCMACTAGQQQAEGLMTGW